LFGNPRHIFRCALKINIRAGKWSQRFELRLTFPIPFRPIIDRLISNLNIRLARSVADIQNFGKLIEGEAHFQAHRAAAVRANAFRLVIFHFAPSPTKETRF
jgi:hypothetical protein